MAKRPRVIVASAAIMALAVVLGLGAILAQSTASPGGADPHALIVGRDPDAIAVDPVAHRALVANYGDGTVSVLDTARPAVLGATTVAASPGVYGFVVALSARMGHAFVIDGGYAVNMLDLRTGRLLKVIPFQAAPEFMAVDERTGRLFVSETNNFTGRTVAVFDARTGAFLRRTTVGKGASALAVDERAGHVFVVNVDANSVSMLNARDGSPLRTIAVGTGPSILKRTRGMLPTTVVVDARTSRAFVANLGSVSVLDTRSGTVVATTPVGAIPSDEAVDTRTNRVFVTNWREGTVSVLDARSGRLVATVPVGHGPWAVAVASRVGHVYVANADDGTVSVLDARNGRVLRTEAVGIAPTALAVDERSGRVFVANRQSHRAYPAAMRQGLLWRLVYAIPFLRPASWAGSASIPGSVSVLDASR